MTIAPRDLKLLWGKAAARCAMPGCRKMLVESPSLSAMPGGVLFGENCHIVAEKPAGPRGKSILSAAERNQYPNLILLCLEHHTIIDSDWKSWPVEKLHQIKGDHEVWVETQLTTATESLSDSIYSAIVNQATEELRLDQWDGVSDHAIRSIVPVWLVDAVSRFGEQVFKALWPGTKPELEAAIRNLSSRFSTFTGHFMENAFLKHQDYYAEDLRWKNETMDVRLRDEFSERSVRWEKESADRLVNVVVALNEFANAVRANLNPKYFYLQGAFTLHDSLGATNDMRDIHYMPSDYVELVP